MGNKEYLEIIDNQSEIYDKERVQNYFLKTSRVFKKIIPKGKSVIEVGSGTGLYVIDFIKSGRHAVGMDYSQKMVDISKRNARKEGINCKFFLGDAEKKIDTKEKFDFALLIGNWEYFENPVKVLENVSKVLNDDGIVIISTLNIMSWPLITFLEKTGIKKLSPAFWHFNSIPKRLKKYARRAKYRVIKSFYNYYFLDKVYLLRKPKKRNK